jgi:hypothetical protein
LRNARQFIACRCQLMTCAQAAGKGQGPVRLLQ